MNQNVIVRNYRSNDLEDIVKILREYPSPTGRKWSKNLVEEMISDALKQQPDGVFVAEKDGETVGFAIIIYRDWLDVAYLDYVQVRSDWMNKGVGHRLMEECLCWAKKKKTRIIYTETGRNNENAIRFYQKHGFQITGHIPDYYRQGLDAVILVMKPS